MATSRRHLSKWQRCSTGYGKNSALRHNSRARTDMPVPLILRNMSVPPRTRLRAQVKPLVEPTLISLAHALRLNNLIDAPKNCGPELSESLREVASIWA